jgi:hypothetical protein
LVLVVAARVAVFAATLGLVWPLALSAAARIVPPRGAELVDGSTPQPSPTMREADVPANALPSAPAATEQVGSPPPAATDTAPIGAGPVHHARLVPFVSQFDGGRLDRANCTLAAGAMLAESAFGIVTTGSMLRDLQLDQQGGTGLNDLATALARGYGATINVGRLSLDQLVGVLESGRGLVVQGSYAEIPVAARLQASFVGDHAVYVDGHYPGNESLGEAFHVMDPLGPGGYSGAWWSAAVFRAFTEGFAAAGNIAAAWSSAAS